jgi:hypothetical protein
MLLSIAVNCWPQVSRKYTEEIIRIIALCWLNVQDDDSKSVSDTRGEVEAALRKIAKLMVSMRHENQEALPEPLSLLLDKEPKLYDIFQPVVEIQLS